MCALLDPNDIDEPASYEKALTSPNFTEWLGAMKD